MLTLRLEDGLIHKVPVTQIPRNQTVQLYNLSSCSKGGDKQRQESRQTLTSQLTWLMVQQGDSISNKLGK